MKPTIHSTCPYCGVGCGIRARSTGPDAAEVEGDTHHPANFGTLCSKGSALGETLDHSGRLTRPLVDGRPVTWNMGLDAVASGFRRALDQYGPERVAFYVSGQLLTEDYYVANKLMKGYFGSANIDTNSRLCMSSAVAGHKRAFGGDLVPGNYEDLEIADLLVITGSNMAWCHPILFRRVIEAKKRHPEKKIVVIDPRGTATSDQADLHLPIKPGTDVLLFNGLLRHLHRNSAGDAAYLHQSVDGINDALDSALEADNQQYVADQCGLELADLQQFFDWFTQHEKTVTLFSQGVNQSTQGTDKVNAIINCHLYSGKIGKPGAAPFSITGQPNAMGGREVGGLANMLAAHMAIENPQHRNLVQEFWGSPRIAQHTGLKAIDLFDAIDDGFVKAVWIMATNPVVSLPNSDRVKRALQKCEFVAVSDCMHHTDTTEYANVLLPAAAWGEKDGTVTNSERRISRQRKFLPPAGDARPDWWIICEVARRMGFEAGFPYQSPREIFCEHAALSGFRNEGQRFFNIEALSSLDDKGYDTLQPIQWPLINGSPEGTERLFIDGRFATESGLANMVAVSQKSPSFSTSDTYPLVLNTGRLRDHWHTMTRTGKSAKLSGHIAEARASIHPEDAVSLGIRDDQFVEISSEWGQATLRAELNTAQRRGEVFAPIHWNRQFSSAAGIGSVVNPATDPISGEPEFKHTPIALKQLQHASYGYILSRRAVQHKQLPVWTLVTGRQFHRVEFAVTQAIVDPASFSRELMGLPAQAIDNDSLDWLEYHDHELGLYRCAWLVDEQLEAVVLLSRDPGLPAREWLGNLFSTPKLSEMDRKALLLGRPLDPAADVGPIVCSCFGVGRNTIARCIGQGEADSVEQLGQKLKAGTNCGSCVPELQAMFVKAAS